MKRSARIAAALLLAGLAQVFLSGTAWAENVPWIFHKGIDSKTNKPAGFAASIQMFNSISYDYIDFIGFTCVRVSTPEQKCISWPEQNCITRDRDAAFSRGGDGGVDPGI